MSNVSFLQIPSFSIETLEEKIVALVKETREFEERNEPFFVFSESANIKNLKRGSKSKILPPNFPHEVAFLVKTLLEESKPVFRESFELEL